MTKLVCALLVDLDDAADFPGSEGSVLGRPLAAYPLMAARTSAHVRRVYAVTGSPPVKAAALQYDAIIIDPPAGKPSLESYLRHGCRQAAASRSFSVVIQLWKQFTSGRCQAVVGANCGKFRPSLETASGGKLPAVRFRSSRQNQRPW